MAESKTVQQKKDDKENVVERTRDFWGQYNKPVMIAAGVIILAVAGWVGYKNFYQKPREQKASDSIAKAEEYYRMDSLKLALNGDGINPGFLKIIDRYGNTRAGNLAKFYAGAASLQTGNAANAVKYLKDFDTDAKQIQARAYKLLGDAYAEQGKNNEALDNYKKAAHHFEEDKTASSEYLFMAAYFATRVLKNNNEAIDLFKELKEKYPRTERGFEADKYLAQLGVYN
ncbi:MAG TPA: tetratricopeptide repeat protein [Chitinophagaceae bacterium]|nr:tetratricopeptide repeat protein [Chitinophagaceae bacterium]